MTRVKYPTTINDWTYLHEADSLKLKLWNIVEDLSLILLKSDYCKMWDNDKISKWYHGAIRFQLSAFPFSSSLVLHTTKT